MIDLTLDGDPPLYEVLPEEWKYLLATDHAQRRRTYLLDRHQPGDRDGERELLQGHQNNSGDRHDVLAQWDEWAQEHAADGKSDYESSPLRDSGPVGRDHKPARVYPPRHDNALVRESLSPGQTRRDDRI